MKKLLGILTVVSLFAINHYAAEAHCGSCGKKGEHKHATTKKADAKKGTKTVTLALAGLTCGNCVNKVKGALLKVKGVASAEVTLTKAVVSFDPAKVKVADLVKAVNSTGYKASLNAKELKGKGKKPCAKGCKCKQDCGCKKPCKK